MSMSLAQARVVDAVLTNHARGYKHPDRVGSLLFPSVDVTLRAGNVIEFGKESFMRYNARRAPGSATKQVEFGHEGKPYRLVQDSLDGKVPREYAEDAANGANVDMGMRSVNGVMNILTNGLECEQAELATNAANYDTDHKLTLAGNSQWSHASSDPVTDINTARQAVRASCGMYPNVMIAGPKPYNALKSNTKITGLFNNTDIVTAEMLAKLFELDTLAEGRAVTASDAGVFSDVWGDFVILAYVARNPSGMEEPSYGYTYTLRGHPYVEPAHFDRTTKSNIYGVTYERAPVLAGMLAGYLFSDVTAG